jgi:hypothetical protein
LDKIELGMLLGFPCWILWVWAVTLVKINAALMLLHIKQGVKTWEIGLKALLVSVVAVAIFATVIDLIQCKPVEAN